MSYDNNNIILESHYRKNPSEDWKFLTNEDWNTLAGGFKNDFLHNKMFQGGVWNNLDLSEVYFDCSSFSMTHLLSCNFYNTTFNSFMHDCTCEDTNFSKVRFGKDKSKETVFLRCSFIGSIWKERYSFIDCLFYKCDLTDVAVDTDRPFLKTVFKKCLMSDVVAERLKKLDAVILD